MLKPCRYWDREKNKRFALVRIDGPSDDGGNKPGYQYDAEKNALTRQGYGFKGHDLKRLATTKEIPTGFSTFD